MVKGKPSRPWEVRSNLGVSSAGIVETALDQLESQRY